MMDREMLFLGAWHAWMPQTMLIASFFYAALVKPERIRNVLEFRIAGLFLGAALISPTLLQIFATVIQPGFSGMGGRMFGDQFFQMVIFAIPPFLLMMSVIIGLDSVTPRRSLYHVQPPRATGESPERQPPAP